MITASFMKELNLIVLITCTCRHYSLVSMLYVFTHLCTCHISFCAHEVIYKLQNQNFLTNFSWGAEEGISIFLSSCKAVLPSALKIINFISVKHERKRLRLAEKKSSLTDLSNGHYGYVIRS